MERRRRTRDVFFWFHVQKHTNSYRLVTHHIHDEVSILTTFAGSLIVPVATYTIWFPEVPRPKTPATGPPIIVVLTPPTAITGARN